jgi:asparagine synthetase A
VYSRFKQNMSLVSFHLRIDSCVLKHRQHLQKQHATQVPPYNKDLVTDKVADTNAGVIGRAICEALL